MPRGRSILNSKNLTDLKNRLPGSMKLAHLFRLLLVVTFVGLASGIYSSLRSDNLQVQQAELIKQRAETIDRLSLIRSEYEALRSLVASYVVSGDSRYLTYYYELLDLHAGLRSYGKPVDFSYWPAVIAGSTQPVPLVEERFQTVRERLLQSSFESGTSELTDIIDQGQKLQKREQIIFALTQGLYDPEAQEFASDAPVRKDLAIQMLFSKEHLALSNQIVASIREEVREVDMNFGKALTVLSEKITQSTLLSLAASGVVTMMLFVGLGILRRYVVQPLNDLDQMNQKINQGQFDVEVPKARFVTEVVTLVKGIERMLGAFSRELEQRDARRQAELEAMEAQLAKERAEAQSEARGMLLANMSHEIRTPMNAIIGLTQASLKSPLETTQRGQLTRVLDAAKSLLGLLNDILDFTKAESGMVTLESIRFSLEEVVANSLSNVREQAKAKDLILLNDFDEQDDESIYERLVGDPLRLGQIYNNLLSNAVKFTATGLVEVHNSLTPLPDGTYELLVSVRDTGIGMSESEVARVFKKYSQANRAISRQYGGSGLGLSICKHLVELMGGSIWVESTAGQGTTFFFKIRLLTEDSGQTSDLDDDFEEGQTGARIQQAGRLTETEATALFQGKKILILEDNPVNQEVIRLQMSYIKADTTIVENGLDALSKLESASDGFALVISDVEMPVMDGYEFTRRVRGLSRFVGLPVLGLTGHAFQEVRIRCLDLGMNEVITKPVEAESLYYKMAVACGYLRGSPVPKSGSPEMPASRNAAAQTMDDRVVSLFLQNCRALPETLDEALKSGRKTDFGPRGTFHDQRTGHDGRTCAECDFQAIRNGPSRG